MNFIVKGLRMEVRPEITAQLAAMGNIVPAGYIYYMKKITPGPLLHLPEAYLKWYNIYPPDKEITPAQVQETRSFIENEAKEGRIELQGDLGFVILHRAGDHLLLMVNTWRNTNEIWESVYDKLVNKSEQYSLVTFETNHKATYCVWELGAVWHERNAWIKFIESNRNEQAKINYMNDLYEGVV